MGEISNFKPNKSGHLYFSLKDEGAVINVVMFKWQAKNLKFKPENGMKVLIQGSVTFYEKGGGTQFTADKMGLHGVGSLHQQFEDLKKKLSAEGLFSTENKQAIPQFPKTIGVVTSQTGAVIRDIITTIQRRFPIAKIELFPVIVQGETAAPSVVKGIEFFNQRNTADVLIVGRGGGSMEDLWAFNEEIVARAIFSSHIPIISAVGHETDTTIADFVADMRAPTPTAAAEIATPYTVQMLQLEQQKKSIKMQNLLQNKAKQTREYLQRIQKNLQYRHPERKLGDAYQAKDRAMERLSLAFQRKLENKQNQLSQLSMKLEHANPSKRITEYKKHIAQLQSTLQRKAEGKVNDARNKLHQKVIQLDGLSPTKIMLRGYNLSYKNDTLIKSIDDIQEQDSVTVKMVDGEYEATVTKIERGN